MNILLTDSNTHLHFVVYNERICQKKIFSLLQASKENASTPECRKRQSDDSSERLWLVIAFINSTASCVIGYNVQCCVRLSLAQRPPANADLNLAAEDKIRWTI